MQKCPFKIDNRNINIKKFVLNNNFFVKMSLTARRRELQIGDRVVVNGKYGIAKFIGNTKFATGKWIGIHLDKPGKFQKK